MYEKGLIGHDSFLTAREEDALYAEPNGFRHHVWLQVDGKTIEESIECLEEDANIFDIMSHVLKAYPDAYNIEAYLTELCAGHEPLQKPLGEAYLDKDSFGQSYWTIYGGTK